MRDSDTTPQHPGPYQNVLSSRQHTDSAGLSRPALKGLGVGVGVNHGQKLSIAIPEGTIEVTEALEAPEALTPGKSGAMVSGCQGVYARVVPGVGSFAGRETTDYTSGGGSDK